VKIRPVQSQDERLAQALVPVIQRNVRSRAMMEQLARRIGVSTATVYRKRKLLEESGELSALEPRKRGPRPGTRYLQPRVERIIDEVLEDFYLGAQKPTIKATLDEIHDRCRGQGVARPQFPSRTAVTNRIKAKGLYEILRRREGKRAAAVSKPCPGEFVALHPNHYWLIDHTSTDVIIVDRLYRLPMGRPTITLIIDAFSRMCVGFYISFEPPSRVQSALAVIHAVLPKQEWLLEVGISRHWPAHGIPAFLHADNAAEFRSVAMQRGANNLICQMTWRQPDEPQEGGLIERFVGTMMGDVRLLPGATFSNPKTRGKYDSDVT
jgi:putative transposase